MSWWAAEQYPDRTCPIDLGCLRCGGKKYKESTAQFYGDIVPVFDSSVTVTGLYRHEESIIYEYNVMCGACGGTGKLSTVPDEEVFKRRRINKGITRTREHRPGEVLPMGDQ